MSFVATAVGTGVGLLNTGIGLVNNSKAKKAAKELEATRPKLTESPFLEDQYALAKSELARGGAGGGDVAYNEMQDRQLSSSIGALLKGGGSVNNIADIFDNSDQGRQRYALMRENLRMNQINNYNRVSGLKDVERGQMFDFNEWKPWADKSQSVANSREQAQQQINAGINTAASSLIGGIQANNQNNMLESIFAKPASNTVSETARALNPTTVAPAPSVYNNFSKAPTTIGEMPMDYTNFNIPAYTLNGINYNLNEIPQ